MATTFIKPLHTGKGRSLAKALSASMDYTQNPNKTDDGRLVTAVQCDAESADLHFLFEHIDYKKHTGRKLSEDSIIAYHMRQAFYPGEITAEKANELGIELAERITKGAHSYTVSTHIDKAHIHNHIIFNAVRTDGSKKFRNFYNSSKAVQRISDSICLENGLSIVEMPGKGQSYDKSKSPEKGRTFRRALATTICDVLVSQPKNLESFLAEMAVRGYEIKRGKHLAFRIAEDGQERFIRLRSLGESFTQENIQRVIDGTYPVALLQLEARHPSEKKKGMEQDPSINLLIDIQAKMNEGKGEGYKHWGSQYNLKQMAKTIFYIQENNLSYAALVEKSDEAARKFHALDDKIKSAEKRMSEIAVLKTHIINYSKTRQTYIDYRKAGYSKKFYDAHQAEIDLHKKSKDAFADYTKNGMEKLPTVKMLSEEYASLLAEKKQAYSEYAAIKKEMHDALSAKANLEKILGKSSPEAQEKIEEVHSDLKK